MQSLRSSPSPAHVVSPVPELPEQPGPPPPSPPQGPPRDPGAPGTPRLSGGDPETPEPESQSPNRGRDTPTRFRSPNFGYHPDSSREPQGTEKLTPARDISTQIKERELSSPDRNHHIEESSIPIRDRYPTFGGRNTPSRDRGSPISDRYSVRSASDLKIRDRELPVSNRDPHGSDGDPPGRRMEETARNAVIIRIGIPDLQQTVTSSCLSACLSGCSVRVCIKHACYCWLLPVQYLYF
ncbi:hypothetical protein XELAEV_18017949mg [Xenopus laevis]|uniref:Uncharacterized protein n=1 Tax=Xenopus laevis TaxID=8355 RepID=A0A974HT39_XENLA|nr:hypothetical protein XELAEV_18017949mg [Xenopus laevis]